MASGRGGRETRQGPYSRIYAPWVQSLPYMGSRAWLVFLKLCERLEFDEHGNASAWYGRQEMAESLGLSERQVSEAVRQLTEKGALSVKTAGHKGRATVYNVMPGHPWPRKATIGPSKRRRAG